MTKRTATLTTKVEPELAGLVRRLTSLGQHSTSDVLRSLIKQGAEQSVRGPRPALTRAKARQRAAALVQALSDLLEDVARTEPAAARLIATSARNELDAWLAQATGKLS